MAYYSIPTSLEGSNRFCKSINLDLVHSVANGGYDVATYS